jgi:LEA14-like dessication related protein
MAKMIKKVEFLLWLCLMLSMLFGCASMGKHLESPHISVSNIKVKEIKPFESTFQLDLRVMNTNDVTLVIKGIECVLELNDRKFATGVAKVNKSIPAYGTDVVPIIVYTSLIEMVSSFIKLKENETLGYKIKGSIRLGGSAIPSVIPFTSEGKVTIQ